VGERDKREKKELKKYMYLCEWDGRRKEESKRAEIILTSLFLPGAGYATSAANRIVRYFDFQNKNTISSADFLIAAVSDPYILKCFNRVTEDPLPDPVTPKKKPVKKKQNFTKNVKETDKTDTNKEKERSTSSKKLAEAPNNSS
jgi:hypothetical protein